ncbi:acyltransferase family protein [Planctobacterium marinum]|uniref:acyltransferase family protein n=1 Tax=Planctobacterium marinum TaxID=1631968 RepID=UPI001E433461|nr:acyltransferase family protein [Planctobacterium marinum]MCC2607947.1 acyltransferase [Planctobacterium marinum]
MNYRPEVDGLRGIAVLLVVLFHAKIMGFTGGFVGVDIFFVISGYLITVIIFDSSNRGKFSFLSFYERRARRIIPALYIIALASIPVALLFLNPVFLKDFGQSLVAVSWFVSNILFWIESGYFESPSELKPLLHTWSLGIEAQFYLLFPLLLFFARHTARIATLAWMIPLFLASVTLYYWGTFHFPTGNFYFLFSRLWEFQLGFFAALYLSHYPPKETHHWHQVMGLVGIGLIAYFVVAFDSASPLARLYPILPVTGTTLLIVFAQPGTVANSILAYKPLVGLGLISYSLYLWHYPLLVFSRHTSHDGSATLYGLILCLIALGLAIISWRFIEIPFRNKTTITTRTFIAFLLVGALSLSGIGVLLHSQQGFANAALQKFMLTQADPSLVQVRENCEVPASQTETNYCLRGKTSEAANTALLGDSHAYSISHELAEVFEVNGASFLQYTKYSCPYIAAFTETHDTGCNQFMNNVLMDLEKHSVKNVLLANFWSSYYHDLKQTGTYHFIEERFSAGVTPLTANKAERKTALLKGIEQFINTLVLRGMKVYVFMPIPAQNFRILEGTLQLSTSDRVIFPPPVKYSTYVTQNRELFALLQILEQQNKIKLVGNINALCPVEVNSEERACLNNYQGELLYLDDNHLTNAGTRLFLKGFKLPDW